MKKARMFMLAGAMALMAGMFASCGGGSENGGSADNGIATDGILGELPALNAQLKAEVEDLLNKIEVEANEEKLTQLRQEFNEWDKARKEKIEEVRKALIGTEIPTEVGEGIPFQLEGNLKIVETPGMTAYRSFDKGIHINSETICKLTADLEDWTYLRFYTCVAYDGEGNVLYFGKGFGRFEYSYDDSISMKENDNMRGKTNAKYKLFLQIFCGKADFSKLAKVVIMDENSDAYKQLAAQGE